MLTQKQIAQVLDRAAARSGYPATGKQCWFLAGLWAKAQNEVDYQDWLLTTNALSKDIASDLIEMALSAQKIAA